MDKLITSIKNELRLAMNGVTSSSMSEKGVDYKVNYGLLLPQIRMISDRYPKNSEFAQSLWSEDVRELKILGTMLFPADDFSKETAREWVRQVDNQELREQICMNLLQNLEFADELVVEFVESDESSVITIGFWLFSRLCIIKSSKVYKINKEFLIDKAIIYLKVSSYSLRTAALNALKFYGRMDKSMSEDIMSRISDYQDSDDSLEKEIYDSLKFEYDFIHSRGTSL